MARGPTTRLPLPLEFPTGSGDAAVTPDAGPLPSGEDSYALQDDRTGDVERSIPDATRAVAGESDAAADARHAGGRAESRPRGGDGALLRGQPGQGPPPDDVRGAGAGDSRPAGSFALRAGRHNGGGAHPRRSDELHPASYA